MYWSLLLCVCREHLAFLCCAARAHGQARRARARAEHLRWECCPRSALQRVLRAARERHGVRFRVGFEVEFMLLRGRDPGQGDGAPRPIDAALYCQTSALDAAAPGARAARAAARNAGAVHVPADRSSAKPAEQRDCIPANPAQGRCGGGRAVCRSCAGVAQAQTAAADGVCCAAVLDDITDALAKLGIEVEQVHKESAGGQFEIVTEHEEVLKVRAACAAPQRWPARGATPARSRAWRGGARERGCR
jgi:hypothetical protein